MLEATLSEQLKTVFSKVENEITLLYDDSTHENQSELIEMLNDVASTCPKIKAKSSGRNNSIPHFSVLLNEKPTGIQFSGIPGGHEFSSLVLAILKIGRAHV